MKKYFCKSCCMFLKSTEVTYGELCEYCDKPVTLERDTDWILWLFVACTLVFWYLVLTEQC